MTQHRRPFPPRTRQRAMRASHGFSLIELMVSIVIAMAMIIAMGVISSKFETGKRQGTATSDMSLNTGYLAYDLDRQLRSAGSGFSTSRTDTYGCTLYSSLSGAQILPASAAFPAPFGSVTTTVKMLPLLVYPGIGNGGSDVIQVMTGTGGIGETSTQVRLNSVATNLLRLSSTVGIKGDDMLLITESGRPCMLEQAAASYTGGASQQVDLDGSYYASSIGTESINARSTGAVANAMVMGNATNGNPPRFLLLGINASQQLVRYDLLRFSNGAGDTPIPVADGVVDMRVRYGVDTTATMDGTVDSWVTPTGDYAPAALNDPANQANVFRIMAVKVSMILRTDYQEKEDFGPTTLTMFSGLATSLQVPYTVADRKRRHRVVEFTVPLRNVLVMSGRAVPP
ncbi:PilW family protein [Roseateles amylovorans]|uniref:PilW family protein n=1 Tax=Roseateles amylovorans TaxID=2978473 RepID=A0ABY6B1S3_9BURK|nr:PilW family protein [Roseateles amylovorans]UXH79350.1 PilW family protein [Roseateles amylovorans]